MRAARPLPDPARSPLRLADVAVRHTGRTQPVLDGIEATVDQGRCECLRPLRRALLQAVVDGDSAHVHRGGAIDPLPVLSHPPDVGRPPHPAGG